MKIVPVLLLMVFVCAAGPAGAQEFQVLGGFLQNTTDHERSYNWQLEYRQSLHENLAFSITYLNEGALQSHSRDGQAAQLWARANLLDRRLSLAIGAGPYFYYDTIPYLPTGFSLNDHGWGALLSFDATWYTRSRWLVLLRTNWVATGSSIDTVSASLGVGYQLDPPPKPGPLPEASPRREPATRNELSLFIGETSVHNRGPAHSLATGVEYRRRLFPYLDWTAGVIYEGSNSLSKRVGLASQLWLASAFMDDSLSLGIGAGPYFAVDRRRTEGGEDHKVGVSPIVTLTAAYHFTTHWGTRFSWNRVITNYERDADVWLLGASYRF
jgi:hypothetical protein